MENSEILISPILNIMKEREKIN